MTGSSLADGGPLADKEAKAAVGTFLHPAGIAVIGASRTPGVKSNRIVEIGNLKGPVPVYPVNPGATELAGVPCYAAVGDIPHPVDVALVFLPAAQTVEAVEECAAHGVKVVLVNAAAPTDAEAFNERLREVVERTGIRLVGPNCNGTFNIRDQVLMAYSSPLLDRDFYRVGGLAIAGHSGGMLLNIFASTQSLGVGCSYYASTGNEVDLRFEDFLDYFLEDAGITAITGYLETARAPQKLLRLGREALERGKGIVLLKVGRSAVVADAALSHTGSLVGDWNHQEAALRSAGIVTVSDVVEISGAVRAIVGPKPTGDAVAVISQTGGTGLTLADLCSARGLPLATFEVGTTKAMAAHLGDRAHMTRLDNPVDLGDPGVRIPGVWAESVRRVLDDPGVGTLVVALMQGQSRQRDEVIAAARDRTKPVFVYWFSEVGAPGYQELLDSPLPVFTSGNELFKAVAALQRYAKEAEHHRAGRRDAVARSLPRAPLGAVTEADAKDWLEAAGLKAPVRERACTSQLEAAAQTVGYPMVLKACDARVPHKQSVGAVETAIGSPEALGPAFERIRASLAAAGLGDVDAFLVEQQVSSTGPEWFVGVRNDFAFGPVVAFGLGGRLVETQQPALEAAPFDQTIARDVISRVPASALLSGEQTDDLSGVLALISQLAWAERETLAELDLNPVVWNDGEMTMLDALVVLRDARSASADAAPPLEGDA